MPDIACPQLNDLSARARGDDSSLLWTYTGAPLYAIYRSQIGGGPYEYVGTTDSDYSTFMDEGLTITTRYYWVVTEQDAQGGNLCRSNEATAATYDRSSGNHVPQILTTDLPAATANHTYTATIEAEDRNADDSLTFRLIDAPDGLTIDADTGVLNWTPAEPANHEFIVNVTDGRGAFDERRFTLTVEPEPADTTPPTVTAPDNLIVEATAELTQVDLGTATATDDQDGTLTATADPTGPFALGDHTVTWSATDSAGNTGTATQTVTVQDTTPPSLAPPDNIITVSDEPVAVALGQPTTSDLFEPVTLVNDVPDLFPVGETQVTWTATDANGNATTDIQWVIVEQPAPDNDLPPDPADVAPPLDNPNTSLLDATAFLYTGTNPIQTGVAEGTIEERRAAVIRGRVLDRDNNPLPGVTVTIKGHDEFGQTLSRADGEFDLVVNGGGTLVLNYEKTGYLPVQRQVETPWEDYVIADDVVMIQLDLQVTTIELDSGRELQVAQGSTQSDADGDRQATILFPEGVTATMTLADGNIQPLSTLNVRATEYTVGENGPQAMPGELPPTSGYTYAVEWSVDEAIAAGAKQVNFNQPLPVYVDNFIGFPTGETVPAGWYDRERSVWIPSQNGRVIELVSIENGLANIDLDGSGVAGSPEMLAEMGISEPERHFLAENYTVGKTLWRIPTSHFTPWDYNWPFGPPSDSVSPPVPTDMDEVTPDSDEGSQCSGCIIEPQSQTVIENIPIAGTSYSLNYRSDYQKGHKRKRIVEIPITLDSIPDSLLAVDIRVRIAGKHFKKRYNNYCDPYSGCSQLEPNTKYTYEWDGLDAYGRSLANATASIMIRYFYRPSYYSTPEEFEESFGEPGTQIIGAGVSREMGQYITLARSWKKELIHIPAYSAGLHGWTISPHHNYQKETATLYLGNGFKDTIRNIERNINIYAGGGSCCVVNDGDLATDITIPFTDAVYAPDGTIFYIESNLSNYHGYRIRKITPEGRVATLVRLSDEPRHITLGSDGYLYVASNSSSNYNNSATDVIHRVSPDGEVVKVAGKELEYSNGVMNKVSSGPALEVPLNVQDITMGPDGYLYISDGTIVEVGNGWQKQILKLSPKGIITPVKLGKGYDDITVNEAGDIYAVSGTAKIVKITPNGEEIHIAGTPWSHNDPNSNGIPATDVSLRPTNIVLSNHSDDIYFIDYSTQSVKYIDAYGSLYTIIGGGNEKVTKSATHRGPLEIELEGADNLLLSPNGKFYVESNSMLLEINRARPSETSGFSIVSKDSNQLYKFDGVGKHIETFDTLTANSLYQFEYSSAGYLSRLIDKSGNVTVIERDSNGTPIEIVAPYGQRTRLSVDASNHLTGVTASTGEIYSMEYSDEGLLTRFTQPNGYSNTLSYDEFGRLVADSDPLGGGWTIDRTENESFFEISMTSGEGRVRRFAIEPTATGDRIQVNEAPNGSITTTVYGANDNTTITSANGTAIYREFGRDPRFGMQAPVTDLRRITTPNGLVSEIRQERTAQLADVENVLSHSQLAK